MKKFVSAILIIATASIQVGCSAFRSGTQRITVTASEPDAKIYVNGGYVGEGIATTRVPCDESLSVLAKKAGYVPASRQVGTKLSSTGMLDLICGCFLVIPLVGLLFPGSHQLEQNNLAVAMDREIAAAK